MGVHKNIRLEKMPEQGQFLGRKVDVSFNYQPNHVVEALCVRDDIEEPGIMIFALTDERFILATECQFAIHDKE